MKRFLILVLLVPLFLLTACSKDDMYSGPLFVSDQETYIALEESLDDFEDLVDFEIEIANVQTSNLDYTTVKMLEQYACSKEYNLKLNEYYGFNYSQLVEMMGEDKYVFDVNENGETIFTKQVTYDDLFSKVVTDIAIGTGVIVICVTLNVITAGVATPVTCLISAAAIGAVKSSAIGAVSGGLLTGLTSYVTTGDINEALRSAVEGAADGYKIGAISGAFTGGLFNTNCFVAGTEVKTNNGLVKIEDIKSGDLVLSMNDQTFEQSYNQVGQIFNSKTNYLTTINLNNEVINTTPEHLFYVKGDGWTEAQNLNLNSILINSNYEELHIKSVETVFYKEPISTYNFEVFNDHTYFITESQVFTHNVCTNSKLAGKTVTKIVKFASGVEEEVTVSYSKLDKLGRTFINFNKYIDSKYTVVFDDVSANAYRNGTCLTGTAKDFASYKDKITHLFSSIEERDSFLKDYSMHYTEDMKSIVLVPKEIHQTFGHTDGATLIREFFKLV